jgi:hypothetical protein
MDLYTELTKSEYLEELRSKTTEGLPTMATRPYAIFRLLTSTNDTKPFYGNVTSTSFELIKNFKIFPIVVGIHGELYEDGQQTRISTRIQYMIFPLIIYALVLIGLTVITFIVYRQTNDSSEVLLNSIFGLFIATVLLLIYRFQSREIKNMLTEKTSANKR